MLTWLYFIVKAFLFRILYRSKQFLCQSDTVATTLLPSRYDNDDDDHHHQQQQQNHHYATTSSSRVFLSLSLAIIL